MTNKPMLSVELRSFLEGVVKLCAVHGPTYNELRALLDKPDECRCKRYGKDNPHWPCPVHAEPGAQNQGEPVAWVNGQQLRLCARLPRYDEPENPMVHSLPRNIAGSALRTDYCNTPLYAEQPAPVSALITDEQILETMRPAMISADGGYVFDTAKKDVIEAGRALLAEVARLNGVKPIEQAKTCCGSCPGGCVAGLNGVKP